MTEDLSDEQISQWCRTHFAMMADGGVWGVPRSGLMFRKDGDVLMLVEVMPHADGMPMSARELADYQDHDFTVIKSRFEAAGIPVRRDLRLPSDK